MPASRLPPERRWGLYTVVAQLGVGGMGEVYQARDTRLNRLVALKVLSRHLGSNPDLKKRFEREARAVSNLNHPNICTVYDVGEQDGTDFIVMEYISGKTLDLLIPNKGLPLETSGAIRIVAIADAVARFRPCRPAHSPPRYQTLQCHGHQAGPRKGSRFRLGETGRIAASRQRRTNRNAYYQGRHGVWNSRLHVARTGRRQACRCSLGYLFFRRAAVSDGDWPAGFSRRQSDHHPGGCYQSGAGPACDHRTQCPANSNG